MEAKTFIEPVLERIGFVIMTSLDVKGAFNAASWTSILHSLKEFNCPRNMYNLSKGYFSNRTAVLTMNNVKRVSTGLVLWAWFLERAVQFIIGIRINKPLTSNSFRR